MAEDVGAGSGHAIGGVSDGGAEPVAAIEVGDGLNLLEA